MSGANKGWVIVDDRIRMDITDIRLHDGMVWVDARLALSGPPHTLPHDHYQVVVYDPDGHEVTHYRTSLGWNRITGSVTACFSIRITDVFVPGSPAW